MAERPGPKSRLPSCSVSLGATTGVLALDSAWPVELLFTQPAQAPSTPRWELGEGGSNWLLLPFALLSAFPPPISPTSSPYTLLPDGASFPQPHPCSHPCPTSSHSGFSLLPVQACRPKPPLFTSPTPLHACLLFSAARACPAEGPPALKGFWSWELRGGTAWRGSRSGQGLRCTHVRVLF